MNNLKKTMSLLALILLVCWTVGCASAEILPPFGEGQIGRQAVVLCESLTLRQSPSASSKSVQTLQYRDLIIVTEQSGGWARCVLGDSEDSPSGWVNADYIAIDPAWYRTDAATPVYAWNSTSAPKIALLDKNTVFLDRDTFLPILKDEGEWLIVSLRGATGWIYAGAGRASSQRTEAVIMLEGMEETVRYEHIRNASIGIEMDYEYESFERYSEADRERFVSRYDDPGHPENYLEVSFSPAGATPVFMSISEELSKDYDLIGDSVTLNSAGGCTHISTIGVKGSREALDMLQEVYIIPTANGTVVARMYCSIEAAEGIGARFRNMLHTLSVIGR
ncbi:MAG: SH3 domain-containing protein [Clostridia bacterium]|nr:SH3 domain-containing protein [Clostridia bacterium]